MDIIEVKIEEGHGPSGMAEGSRSITITTRGHLTQTSDLNQKTDLTLSQEHTISVTQKLKTRIRHGIKLIVSFIIGFLTLTIETCTRT